jgi:hypothetical protein
MWAKLKIIRNMSHKFVINITCNAADKFLHYINLVHGGFCMNFPSLARIGKWLVLLGVYYQSIAFCATTALLPLSLSLGYKDNSFERFLAQALTGITCLIPFIFVGGLMALMAFALKIDKDREAVASDDFKNDKLLFRYGYQVNKITFPIPLSKEWGPKEIGTFAHELRQKIATKIQDRFFSDGVAVTDPIYIKDKDLISDNRSFLKIVYKSKRGSQVSHFIYYAMSGKYLVMHYMSYVRGKYRWHDVVDFVISGPFTMWFWGIDWLQNQYSIVASISQFINNSFDILDLKTFFDASYLVLLDETRDFLKEKGLLTEELKQMIVNNINNSQNISITGSRGINLGNVVNTVQNAAQSLIKPSN